MHRSKSGYITRNKQQIVKYRIQFVDEYATVHKYLFSLLLDVAAGADGSYKALQGANWTHGVHHLGEHFGSASEDMFICQHR